jgi:hypothetical protein
MGWLDLAVGMFQLYSATTANLFSLNPSAEGFFYVCRAGSIGFAFRKEPKPLILKDWLGGLDSNQDSQLQRLMYYRLYDLPVAEEERLTVSVPGGLT